MTSQISYAGAARVAVLATATQIYLNQGSLAKAYLCGALANLGIELCNRVSEQMHKIKIYGPEKFDFQILNRLNHEPLKNEEEVKKALVRIRNDYPEELNGFSERFGLDSEEKMFDYFKNQLDKGCCYGIANAVFEKICRDTSTSTPESVLLLKDEDVFYHQILQVFLLLEQISPDFLENQITKEAEKLVNNKINSQMAYTWVSEGWAVLDEKSIELSSDENRSMELEAMKIEMRERYQSRIENLKHNDHTKNFLNSEKFSIVAASNVYREVFEKTMLAFPNEQDLVGVVHLPKHVICFQHGPRGYFLYDSFNAQKGLFEYLDNDTFFSELRKHVLYDVQRHKQNLIKEEKPDAKPEEIRADAEELLKKICPHYSIRPLRHINPFLEARILPPVTHAYSEAWKPYLARKANACIHSLALTSIQVFAYQ